MHDTPNARRDLISEHNLIEACNVDICKSSKGAYIEWRETGYTQQLTIKNGLYYGTFMVLPATQPVSVSSTAALPPEHEPSLPHPVRQTLMPTIPQPKTPRTNRVIAWHTQSPGTVYKMPSASLASAARAFLAHSAVTTIEPETNSCEQVPELSRTNRSPSPPVEFNSADTPIVEIHEEFMAKIRAQTKRLKRESRARADAHEQILLNAAIRENASLRALHESRTRAMQDLTKATVPKATSRAAKKRVTTAYFERGLKDAQNTRVAERVTIGPVTGHSTFRSVISALSAMATGVAKRPICLILALLLITLPCFRGATVLVAHAGALPHSRQSAMLCAVRFGVGSF